MKFTATILLSAECLLCFGSASASLTAEEELTRGLNAMMRYDFKEARSHLNKYKEMTRKSGADADYRADDALAAIPLAEDMLAGQVEQIVIIDSLRVSKSDFLSAYKLSTPCGRLFEPEDLKDMSGQWAEMLPTGTSFAGEDDSVRYMAVEEEVVNEHDEVIETVSRLYEGVRLDSHTWTEPEAVFGEDVDAAFPYMMSDGCTFYFASRSEQGLGGYDIFRSYRDSETGEFRNPVNMGLPYNSPGNDYMLAIDEYSGIGWWATDRGIDSALTDDEQVTIYVFIPSEMRRNYDADTPDIESLAALWTLHNPQDTPSSAEADTDETSTAESELSAGWRLTWPEDADYSRLREKLRSTPSQAAAAAAKEEFLFIADGGKRYTRYEQLPSAAIAPMQQYLISLEMLNQSEADLRQMRDEFLPETSDDTSRHAIDMMLTKVSELREKVRSDRNAVFMSLRN